MALLGRLVPFAHRRGGACHPAAEARMTHNSEEAWALDEGHRGRVGDHIARGFYIDPAGAHILHAAEAILGYEPTGLCPPPQTCYESYSATEVLLYSVLQPLEARPGSASNPCLPPTGKAGWTLLFGLRL